jgi:hypothetical protein
MGCGFKLVEVRACATRRFSKNRAGPPSPWEKLLCHAAAKCNNLADGSVCWDTEPRVAESMTRRAWFQSSAALIAGQSAVRREVDSPPEGREFRTYSPPSPPRGRMIDMHVQTWLQDEMAAVTEVLRTELE